MTFLLKITHNLDSIDHKFIDNEMNTIASQYNAIYTNYDLETEHDKHTGNIEVKNVVYEWSLPDKTCLINFINALPKTYKISLIERKISHIDRYIIFKKSGPPDIIKFTTEDKELYRIMLQNLKSN